MTEARYTLKIDPEFRRLVFPYSHEEYDKLEQKMIRVGCKEPVLVWYGHIIQAFEQYEICIGKNEDYHGDGYGLLWKK